jgi:hypothetical protein
MNYLPELREAMVDAARRHQQIQDAPPVALAQARKRRRARGGRPLAAILVLCLAAGTAAAAATGILHSPAAAVHASAPSEYAGVVAAGTVLVVAARWGDRSPRSAADPRVLSFAPAGFAP